MTCHRLRQLLTILVNRCFGTASARDSVLEISLATQINNAERLMGNYIKTLGDLRKFARSLSFACWLILTIIISYTVSTLQEMLLRFIAPSIVSGIIIYFIKSKEYNHSDIRAHKDAPIALSSMTYAILLLPAGLTGLSIVSLYFNDLRTAGWVSIFLLINTGIQCAFLSNGNSRR